MHKWASSFLLAGTVDLYNGISGISIAQYSFVARLLTCGSAVGPGSEFHVGLVALGGIGAELGAQGITQHTGSNVGILDVAAKEPNIKWKFIRSWSTFLPVRVCVLE